MRRPSFLPPSLTVLATLPPAPDWRAADPEQLRRALAESEVATTAAAPGIGQYLQDLYAALAAWILELLTRWLPAASDLPRAIGLWGARILVALVGLVLVVAVVRALRRRAPRRRPAPVAVDLPPPDVPRATTPEAWERELETEWFTLKDEAGRVIPVPPGQVWVSLVSNSTGLTWE